VVVTTTTTMANDDIEEVVVILDTHYTMGEDFFGYGGENKNDEGEGEGEREGKEKGKGKGKGKKSAIIVAQVITERLNLMSRNTSHRNYFSLLLVIIKLLILIGIKSK
jgi:hypothetical protein